MSSAKHPRRWLVRPTVLLLAVVVASGGGVVESPANAAPAADLVVSRVRGTDGQYYSATNHLVRDRDIRTARREWLLAWAGDQAPQTSGGSSSGEHVHTAAATNDPDFIAVIDVTKGSRDFGRVINTVTMAPLTDIEPHHMQYIWRKGQSIYAAGILGDTTYVLDASKLPLLSIKGVNLSTDTPCASLPDASWVTSDGNAYVTYMGGPDISGPCTYTDGEVRNGNGFGGTPGAVVRMDGKGRTISETPADFAKGDDPVDCKSIPQVEPATCANPHGVQLREDLNLMLVSDFAEARNYLDPTAQVTDEHLLRDTIRVFDISNRNRPRLKSVEHLPEGPRVDQIPAFSEPRMVMETTVTNQHRHKGAFASTMAGGAVYYSPDITVKTPRWQEVFDDTTAYRTFDKTGLLTGSNSGGSWLQTSLDDKYLFHAVMGSDPRVPRDLNSGMLYVLDIQKLLASGARAKCHIDQVEEVSNGGDEADCPALMGVVPIKDSVSPIVGVGPHWGAIDHFTKAGPGKYTDTTHISRVATSDYFVAQSGIDGDHRICMINIAANGTPSLDETFKDEVTGQPCVNFNRNVWPHGATGYAQPHGLLFAVADADLR